MTLSFGYEINKDKTNFIIRSSFSSSTHCDIKPERFQIRQRFHSHRSKSSHPRSMIKLKRATETIHHARGLQALHQRNFLLNGLGLLPILPRPIRWNSHILCQTPPIQINQIIIIHHTILLRAISRSIRPRRPR